MISKHCDVKIFNDNTRKFEDGMIDPREITAIADKVSVHYGFGTALNCIRLQLGPGKWAYIAAEDAPAVRAAWEVCTHHMALENNPAPFDPSAPTA